MSVWVRQQSAVSYGVPQDVKLAGDPNMTAVYFKLGGIAAAPKEGK